MTLRRRLTLAFAVLLGLFAVNLLIHLWSDHRRHDVLDHLHEAVYRQLRSVSARPPGDERAFEVHLVTEEHRAVDETLDALLDLSHSASRLTLGVFLASALVAGLVAARTFRQLDARLGQLRDGAERIGAGDLSTPIPVDGRDELGRFAQVFNDMAARLAALRETESLLRQEERMASLGKVAAGLAHELNNPAAALRRNIAALGDQLAALGRLGDELASGSAGSASLAGSLAALGADTPAAAAAGALDALDPLARSEREGEMEELLERHGVDRAWELAPDLVRVGVDPAALDPRVRALPEADRAPALTWWARTRVAEALLAESTVSATAARSRSSRAATAPASGCCCRSRAEGRADAQSSPAEGSVPAASAPPVRTAKPFLSTTRPRALRVRSPPPATV